MDRTKTVGIIGGGNMGSGIISGIVGSGLLEPKNVIVSDINKKTLERLSDTYSVRTTMDNAALCEEADIIFLVVKPYQLAEMIEKTIWPAWF